MRRMRIMVIKVPRNGVKKAFRTSLFNVFNVEDLLEQIYK
jgi:hypothetical protein